MSYEGTCAEQLIRNGHPAIVASVPRYALFDCFADIFAPGGLRGSWFIPLWAALNRAKDRNDQERFLRERGAGIVKALAYLTEGVSRVDEDFDGSLVEQAVRDHQPNYDLVSASAQVEFRDDVLEDGTTLDDISPHAHLDELRASGAAVYSWGGWYDGVYAEGAVKRFLALKDLGARLILGPWDHGGVQLPDPTTEHRKSAFDEPGEILRFFDSQLDRDDSGFEGEPPVHYYTVGEGWKSAHEWPPRGFSPTPFYFAEENSLSVSPPAQGEGQDIYRVDPTATSGLNTRWHTQVNIWGRRIHYPDRAEQDHRLLVYDSEPLSGDAEVTGHPIVNLQVASTDDDGSLHIYLEEVTTEGAVRYVTEGVFRAIQRRVGEDLPEWERTAPYHTFRRRDALLLVPGEVAEISFGLQPISYLFRAGSRIRVAIAGADADNFVRIPRDPPTLSIQRSATHASHILLPITFR